jgi:type IV/VI secretion system ImpK/VasF family protein
MFKRTMMSGGGLGAEREAEPGVPEDPRLAKAVDLARDMAFREENVGGADLVALKHMILKRLKWLQSKFAEVLSDHDVYYALFPVVVYFDELVQIGTRGESTRWESLQSALYDIDNGGERFFSVLDERLRQQETSPIVLEVFYFCLADGFAGMHQSDPKKLEEYKERLADRIPVKPVVAADPPDRRPPEFVQFPWRYYAIAAASVLLTYLALSWLPVPGS